MFKIVGIVVVIAVCTLLGLWFSQRLRTRQIRLRRLCLFIEELESGIGSGVPLGSLFGEKGESAGVFKRDFHTEISPDGLDKEDISLLEEFFSKLGMGDTDSQLKRCETYLSLLRKQEAAAEKNVSEKAALISKLGFFAGLFAAVLLI